MLLRNTVLRKAAALLTLTSLLSAAFVTAHTAAQSLPQPSYTIISDPRGVLTTPYGVNSLDQIVGAYADADGNTRGFLLDHGIYHKLKVPHSTYTQANGINEFGQVVGTYDDVNGSHGFTYYKGTYTKFEVNLPDAVSGTVNAQGINDWGQVVGSYTSDEAHGGAVRGFIMSGGVAKAFDAPNSTSTKPMGINDLGQIVGSYSIGGTSDDPNLVIHGFVLSGRSYITLDAPGAATPIFDTGTQAAGINLLGQVVGTYYTNYDQILQAHGFIWSQSGYKTIDSPYGGSTSLNGINVQGQIVGFDDTGVGFLLTR